MNLYFLFRHEDVSGSSGIGIVAEIVQFSDGVCVLHWIPQRGKVHVSAIGIYQSLEDIQKVHGHNGKTTIEPYFEVNNDEYRIGGIEG